MDLDGLGFEVGSVEGHCASGLEVALGPQHLLAVKAELVDMARGAVDAVVTATTTMMTWWVGLRGSAAGQALGRAGRRCRSCFHAACMGSLVTLLP